MPGKPIINDCRKLALMQHRFRFLLMAEPGVGSYSEVRTKTLDYELDMGLEVDDKLDVTKSDWFNKTQQLFWRGSPMVEVRNVSPTHHPPPLRF